MESYMEHLLHSVFCQIFFFDTGSVSNRIVDISARLLLYFPSWSNGFSLLARRLTPSLLFFGNVLQHHAIASCNSSFLGNIQLSGRPNGKETWTAF